jgi:hypothetical protein
MRTTANRFDTGVNAVATGSERHTAASPEQDGVEGSSCRNRRRRRPPSRRPAAAATAAPQPPSSRRPLRPSSTPSNLTPNQTNTPTKQPKQQKQQGKVGNRWSEVAKYIPGRTGQQCAQRWRHKVNPAIRRDKWTREEDATLTELVRSLGAGRWAEIARQMEGRTDQQCMGRWRRHLDPAIRREEWSGEEDERLRALHAQYGTSWSRISKGLRGRTSQQCRARFHQLSGGASRAARLAARAAAQAAAGGGGGGGGGPPGGGGLPAWTPPPPLRPSTCFRPAPAASPRPQSRGLAVVAEAERAGEPTVPALPAPPAALATT